jgi:hypothetical protein
MAIYTLDLERTLIRTGWEYIPEEHSSENINALISRYKEKSRAEK